MQLDEATQVKAEEAEAALKPKTLLSLMKKFPIKRVVHVPNVTADPIKFALLYNISQDSELPPGAASTQMAQFVLTGVDAVLAKYNTTGGCSLRGHSMHHARRQTQMMPVSVLEVVLLVLACLYKLQAC